MEIYITDRIEQGTAVFEKKDGTYINVPVSDLGFTLSEGDIVTFDGEKYALDEAEKEKRRGKMLDIQKKLSEKSKNK